MTVNTTTVRNIPVARPTFDEEEERLVCETLRSGWVTQGPRVGEFEANFADAVQASEAVAVSSATTALFLSLHALGIGRDDEVIVPSASFIATANSVVHTGATPVFVDIDRQTFNIDPATLAAAITPHTKAVMIVDQLGLPADLDRLQEITDHHGLHLIEDAACAIGSRYKNRPIGSSNHLTCFSFHPRKVLVTGDGGMITTGDPELAARLRRLRHQGMSVSDLERHSADRVIVESYPEIGYNFRLTDLQAAVGVAQLRKLDGILERRQHLGRRYDEALAGVEAVDVRPTPTWAEPNYQSYIFRLRGVDAGQRDRMLNELKRRGVASRRGLMATHLETCYRGARISGSLEHTIAADAQTLLLPIYAELTEDDQNYVIEQFMAALDTL